MHVEHTPWSYPGLRRSWLVHTTPLDWECSGKHPVCPIVIRWNSHWQWYNSTIPHRFTYSDTMVQLYTHISYLLFWYTVHKWTARLTNKIFKYFHGKDDFNREKQVLALFCYITVLLSQSDFCSRESECHIANRLFSLSANFPEW